MACGCNCCLRPPQRACLHRCPTWPSGLACHGLPALAVLAWQALGTARSSHLLPGSGAALGTFALSTGDTSAQKRREWALCRNVGSLSSSDFLAGAHEGRKESCCFPSPIHEAVLTALTPASLCTSARRRRRGSCLAAAASTAASANAAGKRPQQAHAGACSTLGVLLSFPTQGYCGDGWGTDEHHVTGPETPGARACRRSNCVHCRHCPAAE